MSDNELPLSNKSQKKVLTYIPKGHYTRAYNMRRRTYPNLATYLRETGVTQAELASVLQLSQGYISKLVNGLRQPPLDLAVVIARHCRIPVESLLRCNNRELVGGSAGK